MLIDSHCHIHDKDYPINAEDVLKNAKKSGVRKIICVGTDAKNSQLAIDYAKRYQGVFASVGVHPCNCKEGAGDIPEIIVKNNKKIIAIGEIGLDYHYNDTQKDLQKDLLKQQIKLALKHNLPIIFHVREAFDDFWEIIDDFLKNGAKIRGVLHSFTDTKENAMKAISIGLYIGVNGYSTFIKNEILKNMYNSLPLENIILETDAPYLTPIHFRGKVNEPAYVRSIAYFHADSRQIPVELIEKITSKNACKLFNF